MSTHQHRCRLWASPQSARRSGLYVIAAFLVIALAYTDAPGGSDAIFLEESITYEVSGNTGKLSARYKVKVLNPDGSEYCDIITGESEFAKLKKFSGKVYDSDGEVIYSCKKNDVEKFCGFAEYALYQDICFRRYRLTSDRYPFIAEWEYTIHHESLVLWPDWRPQKEVPVEHSAYMLIIPEDLNYNIKIIGEVEEPVLSKDGGKNVLVWALSDIPAVEDEDYAPSVDNRKISIRFAPTKFKFGKYSFDGRSWSSLGRDKFEMVADCFETCGEQETLCEEILSKESDPVRVCERLHDLMVPKLRYVAIEIGVGGWKPSKSKDTFTRGYGDCKDLSAVYVSMLQSMGIEARLANIRRGARGHTDPGFPSMDFNHVIVFAVVDGDTIWSDPTCAHCRFGDLPWDDEDMFVLAIDPRGGHVIRTSASSADENVIARRATIEIGDDRSISAELVFSLTGNPCHSLRRSLAKSRERNLEPLLKSDLFGLSDRFSVDSTSCANANSDPSGCRVTVWGVMRNALHTVGQEQCLDVGLVELLRPCETVELSDRAQAVNLFYPRTYADTLIVVLPENLILPGLPEDTHRADEFGALHVTYRVTGNRLVIARTKKTDLYQVDPEQFAAFEEHTAEWKKALESFVTFVKD